MSSSGRDVSSVSTARENKQVICRTLSDSPQKARLSQSSAGQPPLTLPHSALLDNVTGQDRSGLRWSSRGRLTFTAGDWSKGTQTHPEFSRAQGFTCQTLCDVGLSVTGAVGVKRNKLDLKYTAKHQIINYVTFWFNSSVWPSFKEITIALKEQEIPRLLP